MSVVSKSSLWSSDCDVVLVWSFPLFKSLTIVMYLQCNIRIRLITSMTRSVLPCLRNCKSLKGQKSKYQWILFYWDSIQIWILEICKYKWILQYHQQIKYLFWEAFFMHSLLFFVNPKGNSDRISSIVNGMCGVFRFPSVLVFLQCLPIQSKKKEKQGMNKK